MLVMRACRAKALAGLKTRFSLRWLSMFELGAAAGAVAAAAVEDLAAGALRLFFMGGDGKGDADWLLEEGKR